MKLRDFFGPSEIRMHLSASTKDEALAEMVDVLDLEPRAGESLLGLLQKRERLGSTGIGRGVAIPHARSLHIDRLRVAFGRSVRGLEYNAIDGKPVRYLFLIVAPPLEVSNLYLPVLGRIAQFCKNERTLERLARVESPEQFLTLLDSAEM